MVDSPLFEHPHRVRGDGIDACVGELREQEFGRILIIKLSALGDVIHTLPVLHKLRRRYPAARIDWLTTPAIAELLQVQAAMVSSGAAGAMTCATLACIAGGDPEKMQQLPDTTGLKGEVGIDQAGRASGRLEGDRVQNGKMPAKFGLTLDDSGIRTAAALPASSRRP